jgi:Tfp pilus assembly protein PilW
VSGEFGGFLVQAEQGGESDGDLDVRAQPTARSRSSPPRTAITVIGGATAAGASTSAGPGSGSGFRFGFGL